MNPSSTHKNPSTGNPALHAAHPPVDPFDGLFSDHRVSECPRPGLDTVRAQRWFKSIEWTMNRGLYTFQQPLQGQSRNRAWIDGREFLMLSSYDYLGLIGHPAIEEAALQAIHTYGTGSGGVRLLTGTTELHRRLERQLAAFKQTEAALTFTSGYLANVAVITALLQSSDRVVLDARAHRSIVDGCRLAGVPMRAFQHNDANSLERKLRRGPPAGQTLIIVEGIYSMDGDLCPLPEIVQLKNRYGALLMVDEAHSLGVLGTEGRGVNEHYGMAADEVDLWMGSLSKAVPANGGFLAASAPMIAYLQHEAAPFMFSAALCPAAAAAALASLEVIVAESWRRELVRQNADTLRRRLNELGYDTGLSAAPIIPVLLPDETASYQYARALFDAGILATAVVPPAVPLGTSRLRLCAMASHTPRDLCEAIEAFQTLVHRDQ